MVFWFMYPPDTLTLLSDTRDSKTLRLLKSYLFLTVTCVCKTRACMTRGGHQDEVDELMVRRAQCLG